MAWHNLFAYQQKSHDIDYTSIKLASVISHSFDIHSNKCGVHKYPPTNYFYHESKQLQQTRAVSTIIINLKLSYTWSNWKWGRKKVSIDSILQIFRQKCDDCELSGDILLLLFIFYCWVTIIYTFVSHNTLYTINDK